MKIEQERVQLLDLRLQPMKDGGIATVVQSGQSFQLSALQYSYLDVLKNGMSLEEMTQFFLGQGWLVSFRELYALLQYLVAQGILLNPNIRNYLASLQPQDEGSLTRLWKSFTGSSSPAMANTVSYTQLPFFRTLTPEVAQFLLQKSERLQVPANTRVVQAGATDRDLFILLQGQASMYKPVGQGQRQMIMTLGAGSLFGERGFLLAQARNADVVTTQPSEILRVRHLPEFDSFIRGDKAQALHHRFWVLQALLSSPFFKDIPTDTLDSLIFTGQLRQAPANMVLFQEGQPGNTCYILIQGNVMISQKGKTINVLNQGSCFGEISLLMSGGQRTATVSTQRDSILLEIQQNAFYKMLGQNLILAKELEALAASRLQNDTRR
ncbi:cAMP-activated global transcriptional regulator CRP [compost metagenome]